MKYGFLFLLATILVAKSDDEPKRDDQKRPAPTHLFTVGTPSNGMNDRYEKRREAHLNVTDGSLARMVLMPSFTGESCMSVYANGDDDKRQFFITVTKAARSLYQTMDERDDRKNKEVKVTRTDREISRELADEIHTIWAAVLLKNKKGNAVDGKDGTMTQFSSVVKDHGLLKGETWSPEGGLPLEMIDTGCAVMKFAEEKDAGEEPLMEKLKDLEAKIPKS